MWQLQIPEGREIGCTFVNKVGYQAFLAIVRDQHEVTDGLPGPVRKPSVWRLLALVALLGMAVFASVFLF
jgi:hypothetical protein